VGSTPEGGAASFQYAPTAAALSANERERPSRYRSSTLTAPIP
jgi:hypothetical protein